MDDTASPDNRSSSISRCSGEDENSTERNSDSGHLHDNQKSPASAATEPRGESHSGAGEGSDADSDGHALDEDEQDEDPGKVERLAKEGRADFDPNAGRERREMLTPVAGGRARAADRTYSVNRSGPRRRCSSLPTR